MLSRIREQMMVFDRNNDRLGRVKYVQFDEAEKTPYTRETDPRQQTEPETPTPYTKVTDPTMQAEPETPTPYTRAVDPRRATPGPDPAVATPYAHPNDAVATVLEHTFSLLNKLPEAVRERLMELGFIQIDTGLMENDLFVTPNQIERVEDDTVRLNVTRDDLIQL